MLPLKFKKSYKENFASFLWKAPYKARVLYTERSWSNKAKKNLTVQFPLQFISQAAEENSKTNTLLL